MADSVAPSTSTEQNKAIVRRFYAALDAGDFTEAFAMLAPEYVVHVPGAAQAGNLEEYQRSGRDLFAAFPDLEHIVEDQVAEADRVAVRLTARGTHQGKLGDLPATGRHMAVAETAIFRLAGDRIVEQWPQVDALGMLQQFGAIPGVGGERR